MQFNLSKFISMYSVFNLIQLQKIKLVQLSFCMQNDSNKPPPTSTRINYRLFTLGPVTAIKRVQTHNLTQRDCHLKPRAPLRHVGRVE